MSEAYLKSITTGNPVPCDLLRRSLWRKRLFLPSVQVGYIYAGITGTSYKIAWRYPSEVYIDSGMEDEG